MKKIIVLSLLLFLFSYSSFSQETTPKEKIYSFGLGVGNENDVGNFGAYVTNDLKIYLSKRFGINPRLNYFHSLGLYNKETNGFSSYSALFIECGVYYSLVKNQKIEISINAGPSMMLGNMTYADMWQYDENGKVINQRFDNEYIRKMGYYTDLEFSWSKRKKLVNTIAIKLNGLYIYPEFIGIVYKLGFKL